MDNKRWLCVLKVDRYFKHRSNKNAKVSKVYMQYAVQISAKRSFNI